MMRPVGRDEKNESIYAPMYLQDIHGVTLLFLFFNIKFMLFHVRKMLFLFFNIKFMLFHVRKMLFLFFNLFLFKKLESK
jgi:hypothetical protein